MKVEGGLPCISSGSNAERSPLSPPHAQESTGLFGPRVAWFGNHSWAVSEDAVFHINFRHRFEAKLASALQQQGEDFRLSLTVGGVNPCQRLSVYWCPAALNCLSAVAGKKCKSQA